jgi:hypothetical protein
MKAIADKGKVKVGGGMISLVKSKPPVVGDQGKIKIVGDANGSIKPVKK